MFKVIIESKEIRPINGIQEKRLNAFLQKITDNGKVYNLYLEEDNNDITDKQKNLYNAIVIKVAEDTGNEFKDVHKHFEKFLPEQLQATAYSGEPELCKISFESLSKEQFETFLENVLKETKEFFGISMRLDYDDNNNTKIIIS
jgi:hypothetical protein